MNPDSKLMLSDEEQQLVNNSHWILTKRIIIDKVSGLLGNLSEDMKTELVAGKYRIPDAVIQSSAKISKGENYLQLPYVLLDYPRCFDGENIFAVRTMFWWGNFFSITLLLSGKYKEMFQQKLLDNPPAADAGFFICVHESKWHHHFEADNYMLVNQLSQPQLQQIINGKSFMKLAVKFPLHQWHDANRLLVKTFRKIMDMLKD